LSELGQDIEGFSSIIALDNKTFYMAEYDTGYDIGTVLSDTIELLYLEDGSNGGAFIEKFHRIQDATNPALQNLTKSSGQDVDRLIIRRK
jgi:hypothetical protein